MNPVLFSSLWNDPLSRKMIPDKILHVHKFLSRWIPVINKLYCFCINYWTMKFRWIWRIWGFDLDGFGLFLRMNYRLFPGSTDPSKWSNLYLCFPQWYTIHRGIGTIHLKQINGRIMLPKSSFFFGKIFTVRYLGQVHRFCGATDSFNMKNLYWWST